MFLETVILPKVTLVGEKKMLTFEKHYKLFVCEVLILLFFLFKFFLFLFLWNLVYILLRTVLWLLPQNIDKAGKSITSVIPQWDVQRRLLQIVLRIFLSGALASCEFLHCLPTIFSWHFFLIGIWLL